MEHSEERKFEMKKFTELLKKKVKGKNNIIKIDTLIGKRTAIEGNISIIGNAKIDGTVKGNVKVSGELVLSQTASVTGDITAGNIIVAGAVNGNITSSGQLSVKETAVIEGEHSAERLAVEEGSSFSGNCKIIAPEPTPEEIHEETFTEPAPEEIVTETLTPPEAEESEEEVPEASIEEFRESYNDMFNNQ